MINGFLKNTHKGLVINRLKQNKSVFNCYSGILNPEKLNISNETLDILKKGRARCK